MWDCGSNSGDLSDSTNPTCLSGVGIQLYTYLLISLEGKSLNVGSSSDIGPFVWKYKSQGLGLEGCFFFFVVAPEVFTSLGLGPHFTISTHCRQFSVQFGVGCNIILH